MDREVRVSRADGRLWCALCVLVGCLCAGWTWGCAKKSPPVEQESVPVVVRDESEGLLFVWVDARGDAQTELKASEVPHAGRDVVRIIQPGLEGTHDGILLADLRNKRSDGTYAVRRAPRAEFEKLMVERRAAHGPTLLTAEHEAGLPLAENNVGSGRALAAQGEPVVILYGASWCGACHQAAAYLRQKGVAFVEKDIETDAAAAREMREKLTRAGLRSGSIPVLDVKGEVLVGFDPGSVERALRRG